MDTIDYTASADDFPCINSDGIDARPKANSAGFAVYGADPLVPYSDEAVRLTIRHALELLAGEAGYCADAMAMLAALPDERPMNVIKKPARRSGEFWMMGQKIPMAC